MCPECSQDTDGDGNCGRPLCPDCGDLSVRPPALRLSWPEAVRVVPDLAAAEAERVCAQLAQAETEIKKQGELTLYANNAKRDALIDLGEALERMNRREHDLARQYVKRAMNLLQGKPRNEGL